jgi:hypothetical protein
LINKWSHTINNVIYDNRPLIVNYFISVSSADLRHVITNLHKNSLTHSATSENECCHNGGHELLLYYDSQQVSLCLFTLCPHSIIWVVYRYHKWRWLRPPMFNMENFFEKFEVTSTTLIFIRMQNRLEWVICEAGCFV